MTDDLKHGLSEFVRFAQTLRGDEKSESQSFLDHFFRAFGHKGAIEAGAVFEFRVAKKPGSPQWFSRVKRANFLCARATEPLFLSTSVLRTDLTIH